MATPVDLSGLVYKRETYVGTPHLDVPTLSEIIQQGPEMMPGVVELYARMNKQTINSGNLYSRLATMLFLDKHSVKMHEARNEDAIWNVRGRRTRAMVITAFTAPSQAAGVPGIGFEDFYVTFAERLIFANSTVRFADGTLAIVREEPVFVANGFRYRMMLIGNNPQNFISPWACAPGMAVGIVSNNFPLNGIAGGITLTNFMQLMNGMSIKKSRFSINRLANKYLLFGVDPQDGTRKIAIFDWELEFFQQFMDSIERGMWFDVSNRKPDGTYWHNDLKTNEVIKIAPGLDQQISSVNQYGPISELTPDLLWHMLTQIRHACGDQENLNITAYTGHGGIQEFHRAMLRSATSFRLVDSHFVRQVKGGKENELSFGAQFSTYLGPDGTTFSVTNHPMFNDETLFTRKSAEGYTDYSYNFFFINHGYNTKEASNNVRIRSLIKNGFAIARTEGFFDIKGDSVATMPGRLAQNLSENVEIGAVAHYGVDVVNPFSTAKLTLVPDSLVYAY